MAKKKISLFQVGRKWWWVNKSDNEPPAGGKDFNSEEEALEDLNMRKIAYELIREHEPKRINYEDMDEEYYNNSN